jgi:hypothetical protein
MPRQPGILTAARDWGLTCHETVGWRTRGSSDFNPHGVVCHHDAGGNPPGNQDRVPAVIIGGRSDLPGPLAHVWLEVDGDCHFVAAGKANHAGVGDWRGLNENSEVWGIEANNTGFAPWPEVQLEAWYKLCAAMCQFSGFSPVMVCGHKEWAKPPGRKPDPHTLNMAAFRTNVAGATKGDDSLSAEDVRALQETMVNQSNQQEAIARAQGDKTREVIKDGFDRLIVALAALKP